MANLRERISKLRVSELGDVITKKTAKPFTSINPKDQLEDLQQVLAQKRSFGPQFDRSVQMLASQGLSLEDIRKTIVSQQKLTKNPLIFRGETRPPTFEERNLIRLKQILGL